METKHMDTCTSCSQPLPQIGFFCGKCLTQFKCKACETVLEKDYAGCVNCGTPKEVRGDATIPKAYNTFKLHETQTDRTIEATFSDTVGKDLAGILRDSYASKRVSQTAAMQFLNGNSNLPETDYVQETEVKAEVIEDTNPSGPKSASQTDIFPDLVAVAMKNLPASETEWIVVYSFYASQFGKTMFNRNDILERYKDSKRFNKTTTRRDLSTMLKRAVTGEYINPIQQSFSMLEKGIAKAKEILSRPTSASPRVTKNRSKSEKGTSEKEGIEQKGKTKSLQKNNKSSAKRLNNLDLAPSGKVSLDTFFKGWTAKNNDERNLLFTHYLQEILKIGEISHDHIYTCYDSLGLIVPENFRISINNTTVRKGWLETQNGHITVTVKGANQLKTWKNNSK